MMPTTLLEQQEESQSILQTSSLNWLGSSNTNHVLAPLNFCLCWSTLMKKKKISKFWFKIHILITKYKQTC